MNASSPINLNRKQAAHVAVASIDMSSLFSGSDAVVTVEFEGKKLQYQLKIDRQRVCAYKKTKIIDIFRR